MESPGNLEPGVYNLENLKSGTVADLSGRNRKSIIGFPVHGGNNQKWKFSPLGTGFCIQSLHSSDRHYMTIEGGLHANVPIVATAFPVSWLVETDDSRADAWRILWPNSNLVLDLENHGSDIPGAKVVLSARLPHEPSQLWRLTKVTVDSKDLSIDTIDRALPVAETPPAMSNMDTNIHKEDPNRETDKIVTTIATTTTTTRIVRVRLHSPFTRQAFCSSPVEWSSTHVYRRNAVTFTNTEETPCRSCMDSSPSGVDGSDSLASEVNQPSQLCVRLAMYATHGLATVIETWIECS